MKKDLFFLITALFLIISSIIFVSCTNENIMAVEVNNETEVKTLVRSAFDGLSYASDMMIDSERKKIVFSVENNVESIDLVSDLNLEEVNASIVDDQNNNRKTLSLIEGENRFTLIIQYRNTNERVDLRIIRKQKQNVDNTDDHEHVFSEEWEKDSTYHWHSATCGHEVVSEKALHIWDNGIITTMPSETVEGIKTYTCSICGATKTESLGTLEHSHIYSLDWTSNDQYHWHAATCGHELVKDKALHSWNNGVITKPATVDEEGKRLFVCTICGTEKEETVSKIVYSVTFNLNGGSSPSYVSSKTIKRLNPEDFFYDVSKDGFNFRGWLCDGVKVFDEDGQLINSVELNPQMVFIADWSTTAKLIISTNMSDAGVYTGDGEYEYNTPVDLQARPYQGYAFGGWYADNVLLSSSMNYRHQMWDKDVLITARFYYALIKATIVSNNEINGLVFGCPKDSLGNQYEINQSYYQKELSFKWEYKSEMVVSAYSKNDIRFLGWFDENGALISANAVYSYVQPNHDYTLTAKWDYFTIEYDLVGGEQNEDNPLSYNIEMANIVLQPPMKGDRDFLGWKNGENYITEISPLKAENLFLTAVWSYSTVTTNANRENAGSFTIYDGLHVQQSVEVKFESTTNYGYVWNGWFSGDDLITREACFSTTIMDDVIYTASWSIDTALLVSNYSFTELAGGYYRIDNATNKNIENVVLPNYVKVIAANAFKDCTKMESIIIPDSVIEIGAGAFSGCSGLNSITIPFVGAIAGKTAEDTFQYPFGYIFGSTNYWGATAVKQYYYGSNTSSSINSTYYIPSSLHSVTVTGGDILYCAFFGCSMLTSITISDEASSIGHAAFAGCDGLISFNIPLSVQSLDEYVFSGSDALNIIRFDGTKAQWNAIKKKVEWKGGSKIQIIECTDGIILIS